MISRADYTRTFRALSTLPRIGNELQHCFYVPCTDAIEEQWTAWLSRWRDLLDQHGNTDETSAVMRRCNPAITWREWLVAPAYQQAAQGNHQRVAKLQKLFQAPYDQPSEADASQFDQLRPRELFQKGGISHYSCSS